METLKGIFKFETPLEVRGDALDEIYITKIGQQDVTLHFPKLPVNPKDFSPLERELIAPSGCKLDNHESWGGLRTYNPNNYNALDCCADVFQVYLECQTDNPDEASSNIFKYIDEWRNLLKKIVCLELRHASENFLPAINGRNDIDLFKTKPPYERYDPHGSISISATIPSIEHTLSKENMSKVLDLIRCDRKLKLEYELLVQAYEERKKNNLRYSLIQALTAVEVCLGNKITVLCNEKGIDSNRLIGNKSLGDKFDILKAFGIEWPTPDPNNEVTRHRNALFHIRLLSPPIKLLNEVIDIVVLYLQSYSPDYFEKTSF